MTDQKPELEVVPALTAELWDKMVREIRNKNHDPVDLSNTYGVTVRQATQAIKVFGKGTGVRVRGRRRPPSVEKPAEHQNPEKEAESQQDIKTDQKAEHHPRPVMGPLIGFCFVALGLIGSFVGGLINWQFGFEAAGWPGGLIGIVVDGGAALLLIGAGQLLRQGNWLLGLAAFGLWFPFQGGSSYAALNYTGTRLGDYFQGRGDVTMSRHDLETRIAATQAALGQDRRSIEQIEDAVRRARSFVPNKILERTNECQLRTYSREACQDMADQTTALTNRRALDGLQKALAALPSIASRNPAGEQVAEVIGGTPEQATAWWMRWLALVPGIGGSVMLTVGVALIQGCRKQREMKHAAP
jgi:hypothetical protein